VEPGLVRLGELVLLGRGTGRVAALQGVLLRLVRRRQLDHRGQDAGLAVGEVRATETASARWLALAGVLVGFRFLTKMLPALALVYLTT
jgi:4-amino-4-deoxy-L-arabinose transferase-like glycosyltransferase